MTPALKKAFPDTIEVSKPLVSKPTVPSSQWLIGFTLGDGSFLIVIIKSSANKVYKAGINISLVFELTQHSKDEELMKSLIFCFGCGRYQQKSAGSVGIYCVSKF